MHPVIFELLPKIQLTLSSYKVTSFLNFQPFLNGFQSVYQYLDDLIKDLNNPQYFQRLIYLVKTFQITPLSNESTIQRFFNLAHIDYHPSQIQNTTKVKRSEEYDLHGYYHFYIRTLTSSEEIFLDKFLMALHKVNPSLHKNLSHVKRVSILTWILGWGVYSNAQSISKIKDNLHTLQKQNQLQDKQIKHLAKYLTINNAPSK